MSSQGDNEDEVFVVRRASSAEDVLNYLVRGAAKEGWRPGAHDHECSFAADPTGFFIGELGGKPVACISCIKYSDDYAHFGYLIVDKAYRRRGYGKQIWKVAMDSLPEGCNVGLDAIVPLEIVYERHGCKRAWLTRLTDFTASKAASTFSKIQLPPTMKILPARDVQFSKLSAYDAEGYGMARSSFLEKWISVPSSRSYAATNASGEITGYAVVRKTLAAEDGWKIGPLFADNAHVARSLYRTIFESVASEDPAGTVLAMVPFGKKMNPDAYQIAANELSGTPVQLIVRMYKNGVPPNLQLHKIFAITDEEVG